MEEIKRLKGLSEESRNLKSAVDQSESSEESSDDSSDDSSSDSFSSPPPETLPKTDVVQTTPSVSCTRSTRAATSVITEVTKKVECEWDGTTYKHP